MQSGISASQELRDAFKTLQTTPTQRGLLAGITNESLVPLAPISSTSPSFLDDLANLTPHLSPAAAAYILLRRDEPSPQSTSSTSSAAATPSFTAITYVPDAAPVRTKTLFASTRLTLLRDLGAEHFPETLFATGLDELTRDGWRRHEAHVSQAAPLTREEADLEGIKEAESGERGGTGVRKGHVSSGVRLPVEEEAVEALRGLSEGKGGEGSGGGLVQLVSLMLVRVFVVRNWGLSWGLKLEIKGKLVVLWKTDWSMSLQKIDVASETVQLVSTSSVMPDTLAQAISATEPRYSFYRYSEPIPESESANPIVFIYTCPSESKIKERMLYASSRSSVIALASSEAGIEVAKRFEATNPDEITAQTLYEEFHPKQEQKSGFARPKRPGRR
ncbi:MAG: Twinfilin-1 [Bathelium mastoideum]|nr:MAG: Twinfilin-1 [Bathelium mastoideum]